MSALDTAPTTAGRPLRGGQPGCPGPVELARYSTPATGERILHGLRDHTGAAIVIDVPADPDSDGRVYLVERSVEHDGNRALQALLADYQQSARRLGRIPVAARNRRDPSSRG